ncbi:LysR family transcriptional regulator [Pelagibacterium halotolerans]|uniref:Transcriptional regulator, LysR family n=1 Tax=Pelagibacterium halotolerans (strain DSM 22347 / JCM 15775 / CGMCC 1.7692 / B2) TaxID=1082931 RepID=G4R9I0_PELHB|nr:LysR family transcriptional regulator [Pelagibacterium halotolerans]AEQ50400.1 transcriptional regulator, LysR family [Pelagibacterium halotolerans B2]QJR19625.1 LysR family transcriptional regulator [Pelagibacterium halotolerans]SDZ86308.1 transcriptional regulator, LysR family [Pelagibacterium halotolerans]
MSRQRRYLPSIGQLAAFEAVQRTGSTIAAARALDLSQGTVSRLVASLEGQLGRPLFLRQNKRLVPTPAAIDYARDIAAALDAIERASMRTAADLGGGALSLAILPAFGTRWLAPRLGDFLAAHPGVTLNLSTRIRPIDFTAERFDAMIYFGAGDAPDADHMKLFDERVTACLAPHLLTSHPIETPHDLGDLQLFQLETRPRAWDAWFAGQGAAPLPVSGMMFDQFALMIEATIAGLGAALLPHYIAQGEIAAGRLVPVLEPAVTGTGSYWLAWPPARRTYRPLLALREWLGTEVPVDGRAPDLSLGR